jgi:hypothetical protein
MMANVAAPIIGRRPHSYHHPFEQFTWQPGYVANYENVLFDRAGGFTASYMETLLMTEAGIESRSRRGRAR